MFLLNDAFVKRNFYLIGPYSSQLCYYVANFICTSFVSDKETFKISQVNKSRKIKLSPMTMAATKLFLIVYEISERNGYTCARKHQCMLRSTSVQAFVSACLMLPPNCTRT